MQTLYENLPVYKKALELTIYFENIIKNFDRSHKYVIGTEIRTISLRILVLVAKANTKDRRKECLIEAIGLMEELKILIRVCREIKAFRSFKNFEASTKLLIDLSKQSEGWLRSQNSSSHKP